MAQKRFKQNKREITAAKLNEKQLVLSRPQAMRESIRSGQFRFVAAFAVSCVALYGLIHYLPLPFIMPITRHTASALGLVLKTLGIPVAVSGDIVSNGGLAFWIVPACTPIFTVGLLVCFVAFYPAVLREKGNGLLIGIPLLYLGNLGRLVATFLISRHDRRLFDVVHVYLGQAFTIVLVMVACFAWLKWIDRDKVKKVVPVSALGFFWRLVLISTGLFFVWINIQQWYIEFLDRLVFFAFSLFGYKILIPGYTVYHYETFSVVVFVSIIIAARLAYWDMRMKEFAAGLGFLVTTHFFHRVNNVLLFSFHVSLIALFDYTLLVIGQFLIPVLLMISLIRLKPSWHKV